MSTAEKGGAYFREDTVLQSAVVHSLIFMHYYYVVVAIHSSEPWPVMTQMRSQPDRDTPVRPLSRSLDGTDGRGWEVRGGVANG